MMTMSLDARTAVRVAYHERREIEMRAFGESTWFDANDSIRYYGFNFVAYEYRVKP
jgi:hypothetical protein